MEFWAPWDTRGSRSSASPTRELIYFIKIHRVNISQGTDSFRPKMNHWVPVGQCFFSAAVDAVCVCWKMWAGEEIVNFKGDVENGHIIGNSKQGNAFADS